MLSPSFDEKDLFYTLQDLKNKSQDYFRIILGPMDNLNVLYESD
jgi:hypothetical protein